MLEAKPRPGLVTAVGGLLGVQAIGFVLFALSQFLLASPWQSLLPPLGQLILSHLHFNLINPFILGAIFGALALFALIAAVGFLVLWRGAWLIAIFVQGLSLLIALIGYVETHSPYTYLIMGYSSLLVFYLHYSDIQVIFRSGAWGDE